MTCNDLAKMFVMASLVACFPGAAWSIECVEPPSTAIRDYKVELEAAALSVLRVKGPSAKVEVQSQSRNLLDKIPNADKALIDLSYLYMLCTALRDARALPEADKARRLGEYAQVLFPAPAAAGAARARVAPAPRQASASPGPAPVIDGNSGVVITGSNAGRDMTVTTGSRP